MDSSHRHDRERGRRPTSPRRESGASLAAALLAAAVVLAAVYGFVAMRHEAIDRAPVGPHCERVIVVACDGLRRDRISALGYPRPTTPNLDALLRASVYFDRAIAPSPTALASHATIATGVSPRTHFARHQGRALPVAAITLAETLSAAGYATAAFIDSPELANSEGGCGFEAGFDRYDDDLVPGDAAENGFARFGGALREFLLRNRAAPAFAYVDCRAVCGPWDPPEEDIAALASTLPLLPEGWDRFGDPMLYLGELSIHDALRPERYPTLAAMIDAYDASVRRLDRQLGDLLRFLVEKELFDGSLIVVTSTHGYSLFDRGLYVGHGLTGYEEEVGVPLFVKFPRGRFAGVRSGATVGLEDLYPTICAVTGANRPIEVEGIDLVSALDGTESLPRVRYGEAVNLAAKGIDGVAGFSFYRRAGDAKWIGRSRIDLAELFARHLHRARWDGVAYDEAADPLRLRDRFPTTDLAFDLGSDPSERNPLVDIDPALRAVLQDVAAVEERSERQRERYRFAAVDVDRKTRLDEEQIDELVAKDLISFEEGERRKKELRSAAIDGGKER